MLGISNRGLAVGALVVVAGAAAGCGGGSKTPAAAKARTANVSGLGTVLVGKNGRTVYVLTKDGHTNVPCTSASGCTAVWLPVSPPFKGWRLYEYTGDSARGQANGEGITSFGGTWYALSASGQLVKKSSSSGGYGGY